MRKTKLLRKGRISIPHARYFVTLSSFERKPGLCDPPIANSIIATLRSQQLDHDFDLMCATLMPDHIHLLFRLGERLKLSQVAAKLKTRTQTALKQSNLRWQDNYYDHRLRVDTTAENVARYIFLNPYRKQLISHNELWPWWIQHREYAPEFVSALNNDGCPPIEWLKEPNDIREIIEEDCLSSPDQP